MFISLTLLSLISSLAPSASARMTGVTPAQTTAIRPAIDTGVATVSAPILLTADLLTRFVALKKDLDVFWEDASHHALLADAQAHKHFTSAKFGNQDQPVSTFDYPALTKQVTSLALLFKKHKVDPAQFEPIQVAAWAAVGANLFNLAVDSTTVAGKNIAVVKVHSKDLESVNIFQIDLPLPQDMLNQLGGQGGGTPTVNP